MDDCQNRRHVEIHPRTHSKSTQIWPSWPMLIELGPNEVEVGQRLAQSGRREPGFDTSRPKFGDLGPGLGHSSAFRQIGARVESTGCPYGPRLVNLSHRVATNIRAKCGRIRAKVGRPCAKFGRTGPSSGQCWSSGQIRVFGKQNWPLPSQCWLKLPRFGSNLAEVMPSLAELGPNLVAAGPSLAEFGYVLRVQANFGRFGPI